MPDDIFDVDDLTLLFLLVWWLTNIQNYLRKYEWEDRVRDRNNNITKKYIYCVLCINAFKKFKKKKRKKI